MKIQAIVEKEKKKAQALFDKFLPSGGELSFKSGENIHSFGVIDGWTVTRVALEFDGQGKVSRKRFWVQFRTAFFHEDMHGGCHTIFVQKWTDSVDDLVLEGFEGPLFRVSKVSSRLEKALATWQAWKKANNYDAALKQSLEHAQEVADRWELS